MPVASVPPIVARRCQRRRDGNVFALRRQDGMQLRDGHAGFNCNG